MAKKRQNISDVELLETVLVPESEWPYKVPENWIWVKLGSICNTVQYGYTAKATDQEIGPKMLRITDIQNDYVEWNTVPFCKISQDDYEKYKINIADILVARTGATTGKSYLIIENPDSVFASYLIRISLKQDFSAMYLYQFMHSDCYWNQIIELAQGIAQPGVNATKLQTLSFPVPPVAEQQRIVKGVETLFEKLDAAKEIVENALNSFGNRKTAILHQAFSGELTRKWREENSISMKTWMDEQLGQLLYPMTTRKPDGEIFRYIDIDAIDNNLQKVSAPKCIATVEAPSRASRAVETGNVLFSMVRPYLKNIAFIDETLSDCIASTGFYVCKCKERLYPKFLYLFLCSDNAINYLMQFMKGDNSPSIRKSDFEGMKLFLPSYSEQVEIVNITESILWKEQNAYEMTDVVENIELIKKAILAKAFRGELGTNIESEESVIKLLKGIIQGQEEK